MREHDSCRVRVIVDLCFFCTFQIPFKLAGQRSFTVLETIAPHDAPEKIADRLLCPSYTTIRFLRVSGCGFGESSFWFEADLHVFWQAFVPLPEGLLNRGVKPWVVPRIASVSCVLDLVLLWFPITESLRQALLKHVYGVNE